MTHSTSNPNVTTLAPAVTGTTGTLYGQASSFPTGCTLQVWYNYAQGPLLPATPLQTPYQTITALSTTTQLPTFTVSQTCSEFSYQVKLPERFVSHVPVTAHQSAFRHIQACSKDLTTNSAVFCGIVRTFMTAGWYVVAIRHLRALASSCDFLVVLFLHPLLVQCLLLSIYH